MLVGSVSVEKWLLEMFWNKYLVTFHTRFGIIRAPKAFGMTKAGHCNCLNFFLNQGETVLQYGCLMVVL